MPVKSSKFPIVGIGASAGGIEALEEFFRHVPADAGLAYIVVTHLSRDRESLLHEIVARFTAMPVETAQDGAIVIPNKVFVLPSNALIGIEKGRLRVVRSSTDKPERRPIDLFFSSLARDQGEYAAAVILSGGDGDGTLGVKAIKEREGVTLAQTANGTAPRHADMPDSAILTGMIDFAVPVETMPQKLLQFAHGLRVLENMQDAERAQHEQTFKSHQDQIYKLLREHVGHDFSGYKTKTFYRRVQRRMQILQVDQPEAYVARLKSDPGEVAALFRDLLINVTDFFRDIDAFDALQKLVIPKLFEGRGIDETVRVWVPGCATGEEVYSIGILLHEHMRTLQTKPRVQIFATDIDERSLSIARSGRYPGTLLSAVSPERLTRYFTREGGAYVVGKEIRDLCIFSPHSVLRDPPFSRMDLVSCRNLLIYFGAEAQGQVLPTFHYSLRPLGYLFLGLSENVSQYPDLFEPIDRRNRIYQSRSDVRVNPRVATSLSSLRPGLSSEPERPHRPVNLVPFRQGIETQVMERHAPPHVVVNAQGDAVYFSARTGKYLEAAPGIPSRQLFDMARKGLRLELRSALREAMETRRRAVREHIGVDVDDGRVQFVSLVAEVLTHESDQEPLYLVLFQDNGPALSREEALSRSHTDHDDSVEHLERELRDTRDRLQSLVEEYETTLEELKSSNEELVSVNEELQSTNEELEASKEELQSLNEELQTVNAELGHKVDSLDQTNADLRNLFESTQIATIFLDQDLVIRNFTPPASDLFNILPSDKGRPLTNFSSRLIYPDLEEDLRKAVTQGNIIEKTVERDDRQARYLARLRPYHTRDGRTVGAVVTLVDVTELWIAHEARAIQKADYDLRTDDLLNLIILAVEEDLKGASSMANSAETMTERLQQVQALHTALSGKSTGLAVADLVCMCIETLSGRKAVQSGPEIALGARQALTLGLMLIELSTRYGTGEPIEAFVKWSEATTPSGQPALRIEWTNPAAGSGHAKSTPRASEPLLRKLATYVEGELSFDRSPAGEKVILTFGLAP